MSDRYKVGDLVWVNMGAPWAHGVVAAVNGWSVNVHFKDFVNVWFSDLDAGIVPRTDDTPPTLRLSRCWHEDEDGVRYDGPESTCECVKTW